MKLKLLIVVFFISFFCFPRAEVFAFNPLSVDGNVDLKNQKIDLVIGLAKDINIPATIQKLGDTDYRLSVNFLHFKTRNFDFSSQLQTSFGFLKDEKGPSSVNGKVSSQYSLLDYKPIKELSGQFEFIDNRLRFIGISFADISCSGAVDFNSPVQMDLTFNLNTFPLDDFLNFWIQEKDFTSSGNVSGQIKVLGSLQQPFLRGNLETVNGHVKSLNFDSIKLNMEGKFPNLKIANSKVSQTDGMSFIIDGMINLNDQRNFKKQIKDLNLSPLVSNTNFGSEWVVRKIKDEDKADTQVKYFLRKEIEKSVGGNSQDSGMLGVQKSMDF